MENRKKWIEEMLATHADDPFLHLQPLAVGLVAAVQRAHLAQHAQAG